MAANTAVNLTLGAKDWETIIGIVDNSVENDIRAMKIALVNYYAANGNPQGSTNITIATKEKTLVKIFVFMFGTSSRNVWNDSGGSAINRIVTAIRAANNIADNYISTQLAVEDASRNTQQNVIRKAGREVLMMENFDNS